jgi:hypothetical protein
VGAEKAGMNKTKPSPFANQIAGHPAKEVPLSRAQTKDGFALEIILFPSPDVN